jgi:hypothetical protein
MSLKIKTYNMKVVWNDELKLVARWTFKTSTMCDEIDKIDLKIPNIHIGLKSCIKLNLESIAKK